MGRPGNQSSIGDAELLDLLHESVILCDGSGAIQSMNKAAESLYGVCRADCGGQLVDGLLRTAYPESLRGEEGVWPSLASWTGSVSRRDIHGAELIIEVRRSPRYDPQGSIVGCVETGRDLTQARRTQAALRHSEYRYRNLFQAMAASFLELDFTDVGGMLRNLGLRGRTAYQEYLAAHPEFVRELMRATTILDVNEQTIKLFGHGDRSKLVGSVEPFWPESSTTAFAQSVVDAIAGAPSFVTETRMKRSDGTEFEALFTACFAPESVASAKLLVGILDISEQKRAFEALERSETRFRNLFQAMAVSFWQLESSGLNKLFAGLREKGVTDLHAYIDENPEFLRQAMEASIAIDVNDRTVQMFGGKRREDLFGPVTRFWIPERSEAFRGSIEAAYRREPGFQAETKLMTLDGREIDVLFFVTAPPDMRDKGMVLVGNIDISEQVAARADMRRLQTDLAHASRITVLGELTASIAHELNQPLGAIAASGEAALRWLRRPEPNTQEVEQLVTRSVSDAHRAADIIMRVRSMSQHKPPSAHPLNLNDVAREALRFLQHEVELSQAEVALWLAPKLPTVMADRVQLQQVVINLMVNALQSMSSASTPHRVLSLRTQAHAGEVIFSVEDTGPGFAPEHLPLLFESFFSTKPNGLGLGLPVCKTIVEAHGGTLTASNRQTENGARFSFTLPTANASPLA